MMEGNKDQSTREDPSNIEGEASSQSFVAAQQTGDILPPLRNDVRTGASETLVSGISAGETSLGMMNPLISVLTESNELLPGGVLSRAGVPASLNGSASVPAMSYLSPQHEDVTWSATLNETLRLYQAKSRLQALQSLHRQQGLSVAEQSLMHGPSYGQIRPSATMLLNYRNQLQLDQQRLLLQQNQGILGNYFPIGFLPGGPYSSLTGSRLDSLINPNMLQSSQLTNSAGLTASHPVGQQNLSQPNPTNQSIEALQRLQRSRSDQELSVSGRDSTFPMKLHRILANPHFQDCICWLPHGKSWRILNQHVFTNVVLEKYFKHQKYASFMRQVNGWGFKRTQQGAEINSYSHELFLRDNPELCSKMRRLKQSSQQAKEKSTGDEAD